MSVRSLSSSHMADIVHHSLFASRNLSNDKFLFCLVSHPFQCVPRILQSCFLCVVMAYSLPES